jgi:hypothetical protein
MPEIFCKVEDGFYCCPSDSIVIFVPDNTETYVYVPETVYEVEVIM